MTDFIIVGRGLAANVLAHTFYKQQINFKVIGLPSLSSSSLVAAGIWNPVVFKRLTKSRLAHLTIPFLEKFYSECEKITGVKFMTHSDIIKPFIEEQEKQLWIKKSKYELDEFLDEKIYSEQTQELKHCIINDAYGKVMRSGNIDMAAFLEATANYFKNSFIDELFDHNELKIEEENVSYKNIRSKNIIFCEGHLIKNNPLFNWIPLKPVKGEVLTIEAPDLELKKSIFNKNGFILNTGEKTFKVGATYEWNDLTESPTDKGLEELEEKLKKLISCDYKIIKHEAGIRPSSVDRNLVIGSHPQFKNLFVFNGLGTKGVMLAPFFANNFVNFYLQKESLDKDVDVKRFYHLSEAV